MKIKFKPYDDRYIEIIMYDPTTKEEKKVGQIFSPPDDSEGKSNCIQVCGFEDAFDLWGCGVFCSSQDDLKSRKDVQLLFNWNTKRTDSTKLNDSCVRCYSIPCQCENPNGDHVCPYKAKRQSDLFLEKL